jgi:hypothetical protein
MLATAPPNARRATIQLMTDEGAAWVDDASFRSVEANPRRPGT